MKGAQDKRHRKKQDLQVLGPFPGCLGRMINMLDLSNGVVATKMLTEKAHRDVSPAGKDRSNTFKMAINPPAQTEDKQRDSQTRRNFPTKRSNSPTKRTGAMPVKMLMEQDMWKERRPDEEPLNVVARLMGLHEPPGQQSNFPLGRQLDKKYQCGGFEENYWNLKSKKESKCHQNQKAGPRHQHTWNGSGDQPSRISSSQSMHQENETCEKRMSIVREKFAEAKRLATDEKLLHSKEFQDALQFLSSNRDLFLEFLDEPNPLLSSNRYEFQPVAPPSEVKQITILKPSEPAKRKDSIFVGRQLFSDGDGGESERNRYRRHQSSDVSPANSNLSEPTKIVVLKPGFPSSHDSRIARSSLSSAEDSEDESMMAVDETMCSRRLAKEITWQMRMRLKDRQDEESMLSCEYPDFYIGDDSFSKSEVEIPKEMCGETSGELEFGTPTSGRSWDFLSRSGSPFSASCSSQASHRREPSVVREGKKKILERLSMVSSTVNIEEEMEGRRSTGTLGDMLTISKVKDQEEIGAETLGSPAPELEPEEPFSCLPRSRSLPLSLSYGVAESNGITSGTHEAEKERIRKSSSFREKVSSLFSKNKKSTREKVDPSVSNRLKHGGAVTTGDVKEICNHLALDNLQKQHTCLNTDEKNTVQGLVTSSCETNSAADIPAKDISSISSLGVPGIFGGLQDEPSPVSVLDGPFICDNNRRLLYSSENFITSSPQALSRSPLIGSFSRSLSWEDPPLEVMSPNSLRLSRLFSKADEDLDSLTFIQKLVHSRGTGRESCILADPLDPSLLEKISDYEEDGIKFGKRRPKQRLLFDAVNEALIELASMAELAAYPWGRSCSSEHGDCKNGSSSNSAAEEIWRVIRNWSILEKYPPGEAIERNLLLEMILKREVAEAASADTTRLETFDLNTTVCAMVLDGLVEETVVDLTNYC
ncbi:hypothetical protein Zm00014a_008210 [Zea mays]|uniref:Phosphatidylinositol N-acetyglucosaminlytransferase subunit P-related n=2 Tax=Zea mays TaxID=4577 RepID=A0A1D6HPC0_MAIZE|nr:uncharacterized protein LOC103627892 isoform X3 [Zea mays]XP_020394333.1 uncharacterized protein LOC103627892 isoform X3 [Zea mays]XP_020394334.1 uncharacterized protein LOC103627892 isoform X3 [Zea mays]XP_020394335.1 uncharacterized protein LOC103627892 isoform X3 [Zea mays]XP_035815230.1 uncharacterized protein LOC103627892 isoform X3 [Zea mays]XP_035815231.1 uncharacterized protein LOC103627892 isoform X3 [Zea mays]AQK76113.1 Phosphatidylinositol N-acetyglucosaminlytransferase subunit |eukprot:XP_008646431.1 uncharacterized protein LOC103627892 isoform X3 [Zea mays]